MELTLEKLESLRPCQSGLEWWKTSGCETVESTIAKLLADNKLDWANWLIVRVLTHEQQIKYAIFAARKVIDIYEKRYHDDFRARRAIEAAEMCLKDKSEENKNAAADAANAAYAAANAANAAADAANAAADAAYAAADAANAAADAADAAADAAYAAANAANAADAAAHMKKEIIEYGFSLLEK